MGRTDSSPPPEANPGVRRSPTRGPVGPARFVWDSTVMGWRWLTRMRTALYLLAMLGLLTLLATVVPQEPNVPDRVAEWRTGEEGPGVGVSRLIDAVGGFDVYGSGLFLAVLLLVFLSLTACLIPRIRAWIRLVTRSRPPLTRSPRSHDHVTELATRATPQEALDHAGAVLDDDRWRTRRQDAGTSPPPQVAAEKGLWGREGGSLMFHLSFYVLLAAVVFGQLLAFEGQRAVVEGNSFADTAVSYWSYQPGRWFDEGDHAGWTLALDHFEVDWVRDPTAPGAGQPTTFESHVTVTPADGEPFETVIEGNRPLTVEGMKIHQLDWGYSPYIEVEVDGEMLYDRPLTAQVTDTGFFRAAVKAPQAEPDIGLDVWLIPFAPDSDDGPVFTGAPWDDAPLLIVRQFRGDLQIGRTQQTINELDTSRMESAGGAWLRPGDEVDLGDGVVVRFTDLDRWVGFQVSSRPQIPWLLAASALMLGGLWPALYAYRRRLWVVAVRDEARDRTILTVAGRAFQRPQAFQEEYEQIVRRLTEAIGVDDGTQPDAAPPAALAPDGDGTSGGDHTPHGDDTPAPAGSSREVMR